MMDTTIAQFTPADAPRVGEYWEGQGGVYAGVMPDYVGTQPRFLIFSADEALDVPWGGMGSTEAGAQDTDNGLRNTRHLTGCAQPLHAHDAAIFAAEYEKDGHRDFYLPSKRELDVAYETIADTFDRKDWYWSSTEKSKTMAYGRNLGDVELPALFKHTKGRARLVRSLPVASEQPDA